MIKKVMKDNKILKILFKQDQKERNIKYYIGNEMKVSENDKKRRKLVGQLVKLKKIKTSLDYYNAGLIYQHGDTLVDYKKAKSFAYKSMVLGNERAKILYACAVDRLLVNRGKKQKYGTQYHTVYKKNNLANKDIKIYPYDKSTTDKIRARYNVASLKELLRMGSVYKKKYLNK